MAVKKKPVKKKAPLKKKATKKKPAARKKATKKATKKPAKKAPAKKKSSGRPSLQEKVMSMIQQDSCNHTDAKLAEVCKVAAPTIWRFRVGKTPNAPSDMVQKLYEFLSGKKLSY